MVYLLCRSEQYRLHCSPSSGKIFRYLWCEMTSVGPTSQRRLAVALPSLCVLVKNRVRVRVSSRVRVRVKVRVRVFWLRNRV